MFNNASEMYTCTVEIQITNVSKCTLWLGVYGLYVAKGESAKKTSILSEKTINISPDCRNDNNCLTVGKSIGMTFQSQHKPLQSGKV